MPLAGLLVLAGPVPTVAQTAVAPKPVTAQDIAAAPLDTLNLRKDKVDPVLVEARTRPYTLPGHGRCAALNHEVSRLNVALGPDIDESTSPSVDEKRARAVAGTARSVVGSLIPFSGVVRQISGAAAEENRRAQYLYAGSVRRAFLKGYARARSCRIVHAALPDQR